MTLTVAIPTYNRPAELARTLAALVPQLTASHRLLVLDNCSPVPAGGVVAEQVGGTPAGVTVVRHPANIGGNANILRCFEACETEWVWVLGDDDAVRPDALAVIAAAVGRWPDALYLGFSSNLGAVAGEVAGRGAAELVERAPTLPNLNFLSSGVYRVGRMKGHLDAAYQAIGAWSPHLGLLLSALGDDGRFALCPQRVVDHVMPAEAAERWPMVPFLYRFGLLLDVPTLSPAARRALARRIEGMVKSHEYMTLNLLLRAARPGQAGDAAFLYTGYCQRTFFFTRSAVRRAKVAAYRQLFRAPRAALAAVRLGLRLTGRSGGLAGHGWGERADAGRP